MPAGESAHDVARRQREKAARLERSAERWERGAHGEVEVARVLGELPEGWVSLHDLAWPGRQRANLDHVVVGPGGIFVVDSKNWSGRIEVRDQVLMQNGRRREQAVASAAEAAKAVQGLLLPPATCMSVLCFVREEPLTGWARDVMVCSTANLVDMLSSRPTVLNADEVQRCASLLRKTAGDATPARRRTASSSMPAKARGSRRPRRKPRVPWFRLIAVLVFLAVLVSGGLTKVGEWVGEQMVEQMAPQDERSEPPTSPTKRKIKQGHESRG